jgi:glycosyltransferase involved in cell wall biosynthesis
MWGHVFQAGPSTVAIVIPGLSLGGAARVALWLAASLHELGHRVLLVSEGLSPQSFYALPRDIEPINVGFPSKSQPGGPHGLAKAIGHAISTLRLRRYLHRQKVQVALAFLPNASIKSILACAGLPIRVVISERSAPWLVQHPPLLKLLRRFLYRFSAAQVVQTEPIARWLHQQAGCRQLAVIPNAVQLPLPQGEPTICPSQLINPDRLLLLAAGTKPFQKGFDQLLTAFTAIARRHPSWDLAIVGLDPQATTTDLTLAELQEQANRADLKERVLLPGPVGNIADWYARADLFVLSSRFEGIPNVLLEAMAAGCACLAADCPTGPRQLITDGVNGQLVPANSAAALAAGLDQLMATPSRRAALGARAAEVRSQFAPELILQRWCEALGLEAGETMTP